MAASGERLVYPSILFKRSTRPLDEEADLGWAHYLENLRVVTLSGDHASVLQTHNIEQILVQFVATINENKGLCPTSGVNSM
jgi:thioesterase domain-containing protein